jgi:hypothetical protein
MLLLSARMRGDNIPHSVYWIGSRSKMTLFLFGMKAMLVRPGGKIENPERY